MNTTATRAMPPILLSFALAPCSFLKLTLNIVDNQTKSLDLTYLNYLNDLTGLAICVVLSSRAAPSPYALYCLMNTNHGVDVNQVVNISFISSCCFNEISCTPFNM